MTREEWGKKLEDNMLEKYDLEKEFRNGLNIGAKKRRDMHKRITELSQERKELERVLVEGEIEDGF